MSKMWKVLKNALGSAKTAAEPVVEAAAPAKAAPVVEAAAAAKGAPVVEATPAASKDAKSSIESNTISASNINNKPDDAGSFTPAALDLSLLKRVAPHVPLIKFGRRPEGQDTPQPTFSAATQALNNTGSNSGSLEWWDLPARYRRPEISELECDVINGGGAGQAWQ